MDNVKIPREIAVQCFALLGTASFKSELLISKKKEVREKLNEILTQNKKE